MGKNGAGKSTSQDYCWAKQTVNRKHICKEAVVAYLPQHLLTTDGATVMEESSAFGEILE
jgi:ATP-binding cassette subfamily F protein 3